jgi:hypothetical protein
MPKRNPNLHGNIPDDSKAALLLVDVVNDLEFEDGEKLLAGANAIADNLVRLRRRALALRREAEGHRRRNHRYCTPATGRTLSKLHRREVAK